MIHHPELGHLTVGAVADVTLWSIEKGNFAYRDADEATITGKERLRCEMTLSSGAVVWDWNSRSGVDYGNCRLITASGRGSIPLCVRLSAPHHSADRF